MTLLGSTKSRITKNENFENVSYSILILSIIRDLYAFVSHKSFGQWLDISPKHFIILKTFDS